MPRERVRRRLAYASGWRTRPTPRSRRRSTSSATSTSSTARSSTASSPTATRRRPSGTRPHRSRRSRARDGRPSCPGSARRSRRRCSRSPTPARSRRWSSSGPSSRRGSSRSRGYPGSAQARSPAVRRARDRLAARRCARRAASTGSAPSRVSARRRRRRCWRRSDARRGRAAAAGRPRPGAARSASSCVAALRAHPGAERVELAGSARRMAESVKDLDVIATAADPVALAQAAAATGRWSRAPARPATSGVRLRTAHRPRGRPADRRCPTSSATCSSTSPAPRSTTWRCATTPCAAGCTSPSTACSTTPPARPHRCATEEEVYALLGHGLHRAGAAGEPRRARGGRARRRRRLPTLVELGGSARRPALPHDRLGRHRLDRGDGARRARGAGYEYLAITDHSASMGFGADVSPRPAARRRSSGSGRLGSRASSCWPARRSTSCPTARSTTTTSTLAELDWVVASVHTSFRMPRRR